jgi:O-acetylserine/cysteine efflux transporter
MTAKLSPKSIVMMLGLAILWGLSIPVTKIGLNSISPLGLTVLRFAIAVPPCLLLLIGQPKLSVKAIVKNAALGVLGIGIGQLAQSYGVAHTSASVGTVISAAIPLFVVIFAAFHLKQPVSLQQKLGLLAAFIGISVIAMARGGDSPAADQSNLIGAILLLLSAVAIAIYYVWSVDLTKDYGAIAVSAWSTLFGFLSLVPWAWQDMNDALHTITMEALICAAYLGLLVTVAGLFIWLDILKAVPARIAASIQYLQPLIGIVAAAWWLDEKLDSTFAIGAALVLCGIGLAIHEKRATEIADL